ncbi:PQQ-binding-like beta-propeller repeat protein [Actinomadura sp. ATCC 31491]|uniref:PQQ-binding-like beta-propeller repeat protein n=1 Tax=Actinomadura luzonensis TaxID=2805427 RepID=A0ABT0G0S5_9ACTN|nr:PQQ-binding-like beta-propeller repeat protein [Actinomadura luzonensis]MCK2218210.1 PQQ-binding-like beta-propeller repeat protein [Actinomadura luzonensis]
MTVVVPGFGDEGRSGVYPGGGVTGRPSVAWRAVTGAAVLAAPVLADDMLYAVDVRGALHAFDAMDGTPRWRADGLDEEWDYLGPVFTSAPAVWGDLLFLPDRDYEGCVFVRDRLTGALLRRIKGGAGCCTIAGDVVLLADLNGGVRALDLPELTPRWHSTRWTGLIEADPAVSAAGSAYAALGFEGHHTHSGVVAFDVRSGTGIFEVGDDQDGQCPLRTEILSARNDEDDEDDEGPSDWVLFGQAHPAVAEGLVWMPVRREHSDDGFHPEPWTSAEVVGLDPATGQQRWLFQLDPHRRSEISGAIAVADGRIFFIAVQGGPVRTEAEPTFDAMLYAVDIATAAPAWKIQLPALPVGSPVLADGLIYLAARDGTLATYQALTGRLGWESHLGEEIVGGQYELTEYLGADYAEEGLPVLPANGMIYVRTRTGITALR